MSLRRLSITAALLIAAPAFAQADLNTAPTPLAAKLAALRAQAAPAPQPAPAPLPVADGMADLELFIAASADRFAVGETATITVMIANRGEAAAPDVQVAGPINTASMPAGIQMRAASSETGAFDPDEGMWYVGALAPGQEAALHLDFLVIAEGNYAFLTEVASAGIADADSTPYNGVNGEDDIGSAGFSARR